MKNRLLLFKFNRQRSSKDVGEIKDDTKKILEEVK